MNTSVIHQQILQDYDSLRERLRAAGMVAMICDEHGRRVSRPEGPLDWFDSLFVNSPLIDRYLQAEVRTWGEDRLPESAMVAPGICFVPVPLLNRRRVSGYSVTILPTAEILESEQLLALCQSAQCDYQLTRSLLAQLPPISSSDVPRTAALVRSLHEVQARLSVDEEAIESTGKQLAESYEEISLLYTIIQSMTVVQQPDRFVRIVCEELLATLPYRWIAMRMADDPERLKKLAGELVVAGETGATRRDLRDHTGELLQEVQPDAPLVIDPRRNPAHRQYRCFGQNALIHPISSDGRLLGLLIAGDKQGDDSAASSVDMKLLGASASHTAIFLENAALYDDLNAMFLGTLEALTASIDAKDRYTCGHSQRVAHLTQQLAIAAGLEDDTIKRMHIAGLVHDVGKIGVPEAVLLKPGRLTDDEFAWIRKHPDIGYRILKDIPQFKDILPGVLYHHERWDGGGYPRGIDGEDIPLVARLICLADSFDAMSSTRTYRSAMNRKQVLAEIESCAGTQFDPDLAKLFVKMEFDGYDRLVREHRANEHPAAAGIAATSRGAAA